MSGGRRLDLVAAKVKVSSNHACASSLCLDSGDGIKWSGSREAVRAEAPSVSGFCFFSSLALETKGDAVVLAWNEKQFVL